MSEDRLMSSIYGDIILKSGATSAHLSLENAALRKRLANALRRIRFLERELHVSGLYIDSLVRENDGYYEAWKKIQLLKTIDEKEQ